MKVVIFEAEPREAPEFEALASHHDLVLTVEALTVDNAETYADADIVSTFIYSHVSRDALLKLPRLRLIATRSTGYDHIDVKSCIERGITVSNVPTYGENTVAEHVFALLLAISHRLREALERARSGNFSPQGLEGFDLQGKTLGVIGTGNIGRHVIRIANGFSMTVLAYDVRPQERVAEAEGFRYVGMDQLLSESDIITLHVPAVPQTEHLLDGNAFAQMKQGVVVINTARGTVIDVQALVHALRSGKVAAAGLDVLPDEPLIREEAELISSGYEVQHDFRNLVADHVLLTMPNVFVTPHSAFNTREAVARITQTTVRNIVAYIAGKAENVVRVS